MAATSPSDDGFSSLMYRVMPEPSIWNTPTVSPRDSSSNVCASSRAMSWSTMSSPRVSRIRSRVFASTVRLARPRKSIFSRPSSAIGSIEYCVVSTPSPSFLVGRCSGTTSSSGSPDMTTPAAWVLEWRVRPSSFMLVSMRFRMLSSAS